MGTPSLIEMVNEIVQEGGDRLEVMPVKLRRDWI